MKAKRLRLESVESYEVVHGERWWTVTRKPHGWAIYNEKLGGVSQNGRLGRQLIAAVERDALDKPENEVS